MSINFEEVYKLFYNRIARDEDFFMYTGLNQTEANEIAIQKSKDLLITSINKLYENGSPDVDFYDRDDVLERFNPMITLREQDLISHIMFVKYLELDVIKLKVQSELFSSKDLQLINPSQNRKTFMDMFNDREDKVVKSIKSYFARDRITNKYKTLNYTSFYN
jgi:hypothetical protein